MPSTLATIWLLHFAAMLTPGANTLLVSQLAASGDSKGAYAALGIGIGACIWSTAAVLGISSVVRCASRACGGGAIHRRSGTGGRQRPVVASAARMPFSPQVGAGRVRREADLLYPARRGDSGLPRARVAHFLVPVGPTLNPVVLLVPEISLHSESLDLHRAGSAFRSDPPWQARVFDLPPFDTQAGT